jgi:hypothetical protein
VRPRPPGEQGEASGSVVKKIQMDMVTDYASLLGGIDKRR